MNATPESRGISSALLESVLRRLDASGIPMHSLLVARGDCIVLNANWAPFTADTLHRMNSVTKSYVSLAIGALIDEGRISLTDRVIDFFPEARDFRVNAAQAALTVEDLLTMRTGYRPQGDGHWVRDRKYERIKNFFERIPQCARGDSFYYDSTGSYVLGAIVERLVGGNFLSYLKDKFLRDIGFSESAECVMAGEGYSWSDSGLLCTVEDLYRTARFITGGGTVGGERRLSAEYLSRAVSNIASTAENKKYCDYGYGYQIWHARDGGFMFVGMYGQFMLCIPKYDICICTTADNQSVEEYRVKMFELMYEIVDSLSNEPLPQDCRAYKSLTEYVKGLKLSALDAGDDIRGISHALSKTYTLSQNPMGITRLSLDITDGRGELRYVNATGEKSIAFGIGYNEFSTFPEDGYPDMVIGQSTENNLYPIAASAGVRGNELKINVKFIGKHLGALNVSLSFERESVHLRVDKTTECFLDGYKGVGDGRLTLA